MGNFWLHTVGALLVNGHYGCRGAWPGQLTLCIGKEEKTINTKYIFDMFK